MYNRYIPQADGTYRRNQMEDKRPTQPPPPPVVQEPIHKNPPHQKPEGILGFLKQLLPRNLDTADLLIILLILLMAGDNEKNRNDALLTLALYFFM